MRRTLFIIATLLLLIAGAVLWWNMGDKRKHTERRAAYATAQYICPQNWEGLTDSDGDGLPDVVELVYGSDPHNPDTSGDGVQDGTRFLEGCDPTQQGCVPLDSTDDGMTDIEKCRWDLEPFVLDTSGDGISDGQKIRMGLDPLIPHDGEGGDVLPAHMGSDPDPFATGNLTAALQALQRDHPNEDIMSRIIFDTDLPDVPSSMQNVIAENTAESIRRYLQTVDEIRPQQAADRTTVQQAVQQAATGSVGALQIHYAGWFRYTRQLGEVPVPPSALEYHRHLIAFAGFLTDRMGAMIHYRETDPARAWKAAEEIRIAFPENREQLQHIRAALEDLTRPAAPPQHEEEAAPE